jgi:hypothetical protein
MHLVVLLLIVMMRRNFTFFGEVVLFVIDLFLVHWTREFFVIART